MGKRRDIDGVLASRAAWAPRTLVPLSPWGRGVRGEGNALNSGVRCPLTRRRSAATLSPKGRGEEQGLTPLGSPESQKLFPDPPLLRQFHHPDRDRDVLDPQPERLE